MTGSTDDRYARSTRRLLRSGVVVGPLYLSVGVVQGLLRDGFDFGRHPLSVLANGQGGWVQTANFAITGLLVVAAAVGLRRVLGRGSGAATAWLAVYGLAVFAAAIFPADPVDGFPPGTPEGFPTTISTTGLMHLLAGALGFAGLGISGLCAAWTMQRRGATALALLSLASGVTVLVGFFGGIALPIGIVGIWAAVVMGWIWLGVMAVVLDK